MVGGGWSAGVVGRKVHALEVARASMQPLPCSLFLACCWKDEFLLYSPVLITVSGSLPAASLLPWGCPRECIVTSKSTCVMADEDEARLAEDAEG